jgi:hypothetical protein
MRISGEMRRVLRAFRLRPRRRGNKRFGYLHIAKTGGTSTQSLFWRLRDAGLPTPTMLGHYWTLDDVRLRYPRMRIAFVIRDPLERVVSGYNMVRRGGADGSRAWTVAETAILAHLPTTDAFMSAICSADPSERVAAQTALTTLDALRLGYVHHFGSCENIDRWDSRIYCVGEMQTIADFNSQMFAPLGVDERLIEKYSSVQHVAAVPTSKFVNNLSPEELNRARDLLSAEYVIYNHLRDRYLLRK